MRPVEKWPVGYAYHGGIVQATYKPYQSAKPVLNENLGEFCSYCEVAEHVVRSEAVEHTLPKSMNPNLTYSWNNFLLGCSICNAMDNKGNVNPSPVCHFPHKNNTFLSFVYTPVGGVLVNSSLQNPTSIRGAQELLNLTGIGKMPQMNQASDNRWAHRLGSWKLAQKYRAKYLSKSTPAERAEVVEFIVDLVQNRGNWSVWFTVFKGIDEVRKALLDNQNFPGTASSCFDPNNHYEPIERNQGKPDPV